MSTEQTPAGRELDALVAERVMGLPVVWAPEPYLRADRAPREGRFPWLKGEANGCHYDWADVPRYSTDIAAAWEVLERVTEPPTALAGAWRAPNTRFMLAWQAADVWAMSASQAAEFICRAALDAVRGEK